MPEIVRQAPRIMSVIGELVPTGMSQHVGMHSEWKLGGFSCALEHPLEPRSSDRSACFGREHVRTVAFELA
jgi:hypothetical protein